MQRILPLNLLQKLLGIPNNYFLKLLGEPSVANYIGQCRITLASTVKKLLVEFTLTAQLSKTNIRQLACLLQPSNALEITKDWC